MNHDKDKKVGQYIYSPSDVLGTGTWGTVYKGKLRNSQDNKEFAIKKMNKFKIQASEKSKIKYQSQVIALQQSNSIDQVIKIIDFFKSRSNYYIVTEYFPESKDLYDYMIQHKQKFCEEQAKIVWKDILVGIKALHDIGIYHRDLKLQNIVYWDKEKEAKIIDFGMATCFPSPEGMVGSPMFMSPQVLNSQKYSYKCDTWSLGIIFYCMIFRNSPYGDNINAKSILQRMKEMKEKSVVYPEDMYASSECKEVINACLKYEEKDRLQIDQILDLPFFTEIEFPQSALEYYEPSTSFKT